MVIISPLFSRAIRIVSITFFNRVLSCLASSIFLRIDAISPCIALIASFCAWFALSLTSTFDMACAEKIATRDAITKLIKPTYELRLCMIAFILPLASHGRLICFWKQENSRFYGQSDCLSRWNWGLPMVGTESRNSE